MVYAPDYLIYMQRNLTTLPCAVYQENLRVSMKQAKLQVKTPDLKLEGRSKLGGGGLRGLDKKRDLRVVEKEECAYIFNEYIYINWTRE